MKTLLCILIVLLCYDTSLYAQAKDYVDFKLELVKNGEKPSCFKATLMNKTDYNMVILAGKYCLASEVEMQNKVIWSLDNQLILDSYATYSEVLPVYIKLTPHSTCNIEMPLVVSSYDLVVNKGVLPLSELKLRKVQRARVYLKDIDISLVRSPLTSETITIYSNWVDVDGVSIAKLYW